MRIFQFSTVQIKRHHNSDYEEAVVMRLIPGNPGRLVVRFRADDRQALITVMNLKGWNVWDILEIP